MNVSDDKLEEVRLRFSGLIEYEKRILSYQEEIKASNSSKKELIKAISEDLETTPVAVRKALKEYMDSITNKEEYQNKEEVLLILKEFNLIKI